MTREGRVLNRFFYRSSRFYFVSKNGRRFGSSLKTEGSAEDLKYSKRNEAKSHVTMKWQVVIFQRRCSNIPSPSFHPARCSSTTYSHSHPPPPVTMKKKTENLVFLRKENWRKKKPTIFSYFSKKSLLLFLLLCHRHENSCHENICSWKWKNGSTMAWVELQIQIHFFFFFNWMFLSDATFLMN